MTKKILFITNTMGMGGAENAMLRLMETLGKTYDVALLSLINRGELFSSVPEGVRILNRTPNCASVLDRRARGALIATVLSRLLSRLTFLRLIPYWIRCRKGLARNPRPRNGLWRAIADGAPRIQEEFDVAVAFLEGAATYYTAQYVKAGRKIAFLHVDYTQAGYFRELDDGLYDSIDRVFAVSESVRDSFCRVYNEYKFKTGVFSLDIDSVRIKALAQEEPGFTDGFVGYRLVTVSRLERQKACDVAIRALSILISEGRNVRWYIIGDGNERRALEKLAADVGVADNLVFMGIVENPYPYMRQADVYVHVTRYEGSSIALKEALTLGLPVVVSDCPGNTELVFNRINGLIVPLDPKAAASAVGTLLDDALLRNSLRNSKKSFPENVGMNELLAMLAGEKYNEKGNIDSSSGI